MYKLHVKNNGLDTTIFNPNCSSENLMSSAREQKQNKKNAYPDEYDNLPDSSFPYFDNYTGPYWSDGKFQSSVNNGQSKPLSKLDWHSRDHDACFADGKDIAYCDDVYYNNTRDLDLRGRLIGIIPKLAHGGFSIFGQSGRVGGVADKMTRPTPAQSAGGHPSGPTSYSGVPTDSLKPIGGVYDGIGLVAKPSMPNSFPKHPDFGESTLLQTTYAPETQEPKVIDRQELSENPLNLNPTRDDQVGYTYESKGRYNSQKTWQKPRKHKNQRKRRNKRKNKK
ncbi:hypothetical protein 2 [Changjiang sobemo-like virus 2]|uniref:hypothetical protein 2 n=1 Tax=Changjiang sobemo-like virus 2 TaxID=1922801 RepID=UPI00090A412E|nr:hypothetical protein 2 [Changjiang sobemo-like virus 2]APG75732.1 hypothetical protein 2 [Changjiang sobemo-like virus 2]